MKIGSIFAGYLTSISTFFGFNTPKGPQEHAICVNVVSSGIFTYNDQATKDACTLLQSKPSGGCHDCKIVMSSLLEIIIDDQIASSLLDPYPLTRDIPQIEKESIFCHSPDVKIDHLKVIFCPVRNKE
ncbi:hypothetical protein GcM1_215019 [Golovinomyces cichoracearum]|uniref:Uncharacterized protein n=1 Tax=Golovinomyces cichoracearum TaxID=62708 RepID=A0A420ITM1_9PEZI|nr:hypothetical protein GcM1_215019 [Golovinomyces cichoracearum]